MKYIFSLFLAFLTINFSYGQVSGQIAGGAGGAFGIGGKATTDPFLAARMADLRSKKNSVEEEILGSPYLNDEFIKSKVYFGEDYIGDYYIRYNALNSEIEIKESNLPEEKPKRLLADDKVRIKYAKRELRFTTYITKKNETKNGYLSIISEGDSYTLYHRLAVKYSEGKAAANSMVMAIPSRYAHFTEYYYKKAGVDRIDQLAQKRGALLKILDKEIRDQVSTFIKEEKIDLSEEADLIRTFEYINSIDTSS
ncbi:hypothetical protein [Muriicola soli]|uniref:Uncharacterized protein n=1 Tax=Muriicola soli TaxID=2507538 RepID=A0A411EAW4_9FLAO|nr:hypothetical protein [Muriicola soli]QBA64871.1 hypothetical protein EQY75_10215 [Muriicola soli]